MFGCCAQNKGFILYRQKSRNVQRKQDEILSFTNIENKLPHAYTSAEYTLQLKIIISFNQNRNLINVKSNIIKTFRDYTN